jgi:addiction module RelB/DinJ family antitoxin
MSTKQKSIEIQNNKSTLIQIRIKPIQKEKLDNIFDQLGMTTTQAISMFLSEVERTLRVPLNLELKPTNSKHENMNDKLELSPTQLKDILASYKDIENGNIKTMKNNQDIDNFINLLNK